MNIEAVFAALLVLTDEFDQEQRRAARKGMTEKTQALFDLLIKPELTKVDIKRLKAVATGRYETLRAKISAIQDFAAKQATRDHVKQEIQDYLIRDNGLPSSYDMPEITLKADAVYAHLLMQVG